MAENALMPLRQADIVVVGLTLTVVLYPDGETGFVLPPFCAGLDLDADDQTHRLRKHRVLSAALMLTQVQTAGGPQITNVLLTWGVSLWLGSLRIGRRTPEYQARIEALQREVSRAAAKQFSRAAPTPEESEAPATHLAPSSIQPDVAPRSAWDRLLAALDETKQALVALREEEQAERARLEQRLLEQEQRVADLKEWFTSLDRQVAILGQRQQEPTLSATHLSDLKAIFRDLEQATKRTQAQAEAELSTLFKVEAVTAIPDTFWPEVLAWYAWSATRS